MNGERLRVLIVEDEALVAMLIEDVLCDLGHDVAGIAGGLKEGLALAREVEADFAVVDLNLNGERTYAIADILKARCIPFMFVTGYGVAGVADEWRGQAVLQKPFEVAEFEAALARAQI